MRYLLFIAIVATIVVACGKDTIKSKPGLSLKSVSTTTVEAYKDLEIVLTLTDKEADFSNTLFVEKKTTRCLNSNFLDSQLYTIPKDAPRTSPFKADILLSFTYALELQPRCNRPDTTTFRFWIRDAAGNVSDTATTPKIIILRP
jgi:hypothetical protein